MKWGYNIERSCDTTLTRSGDSCMKCYTLFLTITLITFNFCFATQKNCETNIVNGRGVGYQLQWIVEKMQYFHTYKLISRQMSCPLCREGKWSNLRLAIHLNTQ